MAGGWEWLSGLRGASSRTREPRMPVPLRESRTLTRPVRLVVALDESGSTACSDPSRQSHAALLELCEWVATHSGDPRDRIGLVRFADRAESVSPVVAAKARTALEQQLLAPADVGGGTQLAPAVDALCGELGHGLARGVAVVVTDGQVAESDEQLRRLFGRLCAAGDAVYVVGLDHDGAWSRATYARYEALGLSGTVTIGALTKAQLAHALATLLMAETGLRSRRSWRWRGR